MRYPFLFLFLLTLATSCVDEIEFDRGKDADLLVVDGLLSTWPDTNYLQLSRTDVVSKSKSFPAVDDATITLWNQEGQRAMYHAQGSGKYYITQQQLPVRVGQTYHIRIQTQEGTIYESLPETILPAPKMDSVPYSFTVEEIIVDETRLVERRFFDLHIVISLPEDTPPASLKWDIEHVFQVNEFICNPLVPPRTCYTRKAVNIGRVEIMDGTRLTKGFTLERQILRVPVDFAFGLVASFYVKQRSLTPGALLYWQRVAQIIQDGGSIFSAPPAGITGNMINPDQPDEVVLGYFQVSDEDRKLALVTRGDQDPEYSELPYCGLPGLPPSEFRPACCNCLLIDIDNTSYQRPSYWP